jgi:hypothetical protein
MSALDVMFGRRKQPWESGVILDQYGDPSDDEDEDPSDETGDVATAPSASLPSLAGYTATGANGIPLILPPTPAQTPNPADRDAEAISQSAPKPDDQQIVGSSKRHPALEALQQHQAAMPEIPKVSGWRKVLGAMAGGAAGYYNAANPNSNPIDPARAAAPIKYGDYGDRRAQWEQKERALEKAAEVERRQDQYARDEEVQRSRQAAYDAMKARANRPAAPPKPQPASARYVHTANGLYDAQTGQIVQGTAPAPKPPAETKPTGVYANINDPKERERLAREEVESRIRRNNRPPQSAERTDNGLTPNQLATGMSRARQQRRAGDRQARADWDEAKKQTDAYWSRGGEGYRLANSPDPSIRAGAEAKKKQQYDSINQSLAAALQEGEDNFKASVEDLTGKPQPRYNYKTKKLEGAGGAGSADTAPAATPTPAAAPARATVRMKAPDGTVKTVSADQVAHYLKLGAKRI